MNDFKVAGIYLYDTKVFTDLDYAQGFVTNTPVFNAIVHVNTYNNQLLRQGNIRTQVTLLKGRLLVMLLTPTWYCLIAKLFTH